MGADFQVLTHLPHQDDMLLTGIENWMYDLNVVKKLMQAPDYNCRLLGMIPVLTWASGDDEKFLELTHHFSFCETLKMFQNVGGLTDLTPLVPLFKAVVRQKFGEKYPDMAGRKHLVVPMKAYPELPWYMSQAFPGNSMGYLKTPTLDCVFTTVKEVQELEHLDIMGTEIFPYRSDLSSQIVPLTETSLKPWLKESGVNYKNSALLRALADSKLKLGYTCAFSSVGRDWASNRTADGVIGIKLVIEFSRIPNHMKNLGSTAWKNLLDDADNILGLSTNRGNSKITIILTTKYVKPRLITYTGGDTNGLSC